MSEITMVRHSISAYPADALSAEGIALAERRSGDFANFPLVITSERQRAIDTAVALGYPDNRQDARFNELELPDVNADTAHNYVMAAHSQEPSLVAATAEALLEGLLEVASYEEGYALIVTHNLALSALLLTLSGQQVSFDFLSGIWVEIDGGQVNQVTTHGTVYS